ncbi:MAG: helix-turn-helix domain-containing protein, partial [Thermoanaerobaculia bacterium]
MAGTSDNPRLILGLKLRDRRQGKGLTLADLAARAGLSISYLSEVERGRKYPKPEILQRLSAALALPFDELVSLQVSGELAPLKAALESPLLRGFPFELFGIEPHDLVELAGEDPARFAAFLHTFVEVGRSYDLRVEQFLLAALRSYQQLHRNYFADLEEAALAFRRRHLRQPPGPLPPEELSGLLVRLYGYELDTATLAAAADLASFRSAFRGGRRPRLFLNSRLQPSQRAFVLARELGYRHLDLRERAVSSSWLKVESWDQVLNHFKASYFAGALLLDREELLADLGGFFERPRWDGQALLAMMERTAVTPETFFTRLTQLLPEFFGLAEIFFLRFTVPVDAEGYRLTKFLNLSSVPVPHDVGLNEHYCRRWPALRLLGSAASSAAAAPVVVAQRSHFLDEDAEFFVIAMARPLALAEERNSSVTLGFRL